MADDSAASTRSPMTLRSPQERKEILRRAITQAEILKENVTDKTVQTLEICMQQTDTINAETSINEKIQNQEEVLLDSEMVNMSSKVLKRCTRSLTKGVRSYDYAEFAEKLVNHVRRLRDTQQEAPPAWSVLELRLAKRFFRTPIHSPLQGLLRPIEGKEARKRRTITRDAQAPLKRPENIVAVDKEEEGLEHTARMKQFITRYHRMHRKPVDFFRLVLHPNDFGKTVQNILQVSFLARDGKVKLTKDNSGVLVVLPRRKEAATETRHDGSDEKNLNVQNVVYISVDQWRILRDAYRLKEPMIDFDVKT